LLLVLQSPLGSQVRAAASEVLALDSQQTRWYVTRAAGLLAYLLLWLSTAWGLAISTRIHDAGLPRAFTFDAHEFLSLLALGFTAVHIGALAFDHYLPFSLAQLLIPFIATYRPEWVGLGVIGMYVAILVSVTFYLRRRIGTAAFRRIHYLSYASYGLVTLHAWFAGTDTPLAATAPCTWPVSSSSCLRASSESPRPRSQRLTHRSSTMSSTATPPFG
jgi:methionine sulfoxide reductase heme-binding subunit